MTGIDISQFSLDQLAALTRQAQELKKGLQQAEQERLGEIVQPVMAGILADVQEFETSETSGWTGHKVFGIPVTHDGRKFTVSLTFTDVAATEANKDALKKAKKPVSLKK